MGSPQNDSNCGEMAGIAAGTEDRVNTGPQILRPTEPALILDIARPIRSRAGPHNSCTFDSRFTILISSPTDAALVMGWITRGWITRRIAGFITFATVSALLGGYATFRGWISGELTLTTTMGAIILGIAFLASLIVTSRMKTTDDTRKAWEAWEQNQRAWQEYYARIYAAYGRRRL